MTTPRIAGLSHPSRFASSRGSMLVQIAGALALLSALAVGLAYKTGEYFAKRRVLEAANLIALADQQIRQFAVDNGRLPCPASDESGLENCAAGLQKGYLPYLTLGLSSNRYVYSEVAIRYGAFNAGAGNNLTQPPIAFAAADADGLTNSGSARNMLDLCVALKSSALLGFSNARLNVARGAGVQVAFALSTPGASDLDGINGPYDGLNGSSTTSFEAPETLRSDTYDDSTAYRGFDELYGLMRCEATMQSMHTLANTVALENEVIDFADANTEAAAQGFQSNVVGAAINTWGLVQGIASIAAANEVLGVSTGLLAGATAACAIPPFVACALVPVYASAVSSAGSGLGAAIASTVLWGTAVGLQVAAAVMYADVKAKTGAVDRSSAPPDGNALSDALSDYNAKLANANAKAAAAAALQGPRNAAVATRAAAAAALTNAANSLPAVLKTAVINQVSGKFTPTVDGSGNPVYVPGTSPPVQQQTTVVLGVTPAIDQVYDAQSQAALSSVLSGLDANPPITLTSTVSVAAAQADVDTQRTNFGTLASRLAAYESAKIADEAGSNPSTQSARASAKSSLEALTGAFSEAGLPAGGLCGGTACGFAALGTAYFGTAGAGTYGAYGDAKTKTDAYDAAQKEATQAQSDADSAYRKYRSLQCSSTNNDYDAAGDSCTADPPGTQARGAAQSAICTPGNDAYDAATCTKIQQSASGSSASQIVPIGGAANILQQLRDKGSVK